LKILLLCLLLAGCAWVPVAHIPADKEGALIIRCHAYKGLIRRESRWMVIVWVWSKSGAIPDNPGNLEIDPDCGWSVERDRGTDHSSGGTVPAGGGAAGGSGPGQPAAGPGPTPAAGPGPDPAAI